MLLKLFLLFTLVPLMEIYLLIKIGGQIGASSTILIVIFTGFLGAYLARMQGASTMNKVRLNMARGVAPTGELVDALLIFVAGVVLITPGFLTDLAGFTLLVPPARKVIKDWLRKKFDAAVQSGNVRIINHD
jgi:UPF0716 protein FxsA